jgi:radical SAM superfamily enzyme YgiQ (UPF0313 family)
MKIALINPPWYSPVAQKFQTHNLGLSYVTSFVRERGHTVLPIDALFDTKETPVELVPVSFPYQEVFRVGQSFDTIVKQIPADVGLVGIAGPTSNHARIIKELAATIKKKYPKMKILIGGPYPSANPEDVPTLNVDYGIDGEPEVLLDQLLSGVPEAEIKGLIYNDGKEWKFNGKAELPKDLDTIPFPARDVFHCNEILDRQADAKLRRGTEIYTRKARGVPIILSRGCPYSCGFCSISLMNGKKWRYRSPENAVAEMIELRDRYNVEEIGILDDHLVGNRARLMAIMDLMIKKKVGLKWMLPNGVRVDYLDRELMQKMKDSGCSSLVLGIQHGSQSMIKIMNTKLNLNKVEQVVKDGKEIGLNMAAFLIVGYPGETREYFMESLKFCKKIGKKYGIHDWRINVARAYPKTKLDILCREKDYYIRKDVENLVYFPGDDTEANIKTPEFDAAEVLRRREYAKRQLMSTENPLYWNMVYYLERFKVKDAIKKVMPEKMWNAQKKFIYDKFKKVVA